MASDIHSPTWWRRACLLSHATGTSPRTTTHCYARQGARVAPAFGVEGELLEAACWLHDIGYAPPLATTRFHPLDGAEFLHATGWSDRLCGLVAHHSCAIREARLRGLDEDLLGRFPDEGLSPLRDALWYCDMTTSPDGDEVTVEHRLSEILARYGKGSVVFEFIEEARADLLDSVIRTESRVRKSYSTDVRLR
ncbi:HD domain-containing protein [Nocardia sp. NPDC004278]